MKFSPRFLSRPYARVKKSIQFSYHESFCESVSERGLNGRAGKGQATGGGGWDWEKATPEENPTESQVTEILPKRKVSCSIHGKNRKQKLKINF